MQNQNGQTISILIPNFNGLKYLKICVPSILNQTHRDTELIIADNGSTDGSIEYTKTIPKAKLVRNERNLGFAKAVNQASRLATGSFLFVLNNDTMLEPECIENLLSAFDTWEKRKTRLAGISPKILFYDFPTIIDAVGTGINSDGTGYNIGVGQVDLGQFDSPSRIFGLCFAAAFLKRDLFEKIGQLEESYFAYYEDVDWCYRANAQGYEFRSAPDARVYHLHSATARKSIQYGDKRYLLGRNKLRTIFRNYQARHFPKVIRPIGGHILAIYNVTRHPLSRPLKASVQELNVNLRVLLDLAKAPVRLHENVKLNAGRHVSDQEIWRISDTWRPWLVAGTFIDEAHAPVFTIGTLERSYRLLAKLEGKEHFKEACTALNSLSSILEERPWPLDKPEELNSKPSKGFRLGGWIARSAVNLFIVKRNQMMATDSFVLDLLLSFQGRDREEVISHLDRKLQLCLGSNVTGSGASTEWLSKQCISIYGPQFEKLGLIKNGGSSV